MGDYTSSEVEIRWNNESLNCLGLWFSFVVFFFFNIQAKQKKIDQIKTGSLC